MATAPTPHAPGRRYGPGDRVSVTRDTHYDGPISAGEPGTVLYASSVSHATANGGGVDVTVRLDSGRTVLLRSWQLAPAGLPTTREAFTDRVRDLLS